MQEFPRDWHKPPKGYRPMVRWWWPGLDVEKEELIREIEELDAFGIGGVEVQPFLFGVSRQKRKDRAEYLHRFLKEYHFEMLQAVLERSKALGMFVDLTICASWPPGGTHIDYEKNMQILIMGTEKVKGQNKTPLRLPEMNLSPYYKKDKLMKGIVGFVQSKFRMDLFKPVAVCACKSLKHDGDPNYMFPKARLLDNTSIIDLSPYVDPKNRSINYELPKGTWRLFVFFGGPSCMTPMNDVRDDVNKLSLTLDHLDKSVIQFHLSKLLPQTFLDSKLVEGTLRAIFTDSQELAAEWFWTPKFFEYFIAKRGYDIRKFLPVCLVPNHDNQYFFVFFQGEKPCYDFPNGLGDRLRYDYWLTVSDLFCEEFTQGISEFLGPKGLKNRIQAYGIHADLLKCYGRADIPESEQLFAGGLLDFLRLAGSAGVLYSKKEVSCESLVWADREYLTTPLKWKVAADRLFIAGINRMIYHGYPYFSKEDAFPGYYPFNPPDFSDNFNRNNSFSPYFHLLNSYVSRGQYLMQTGQTVVEIAIFYPHFNYDYKQIHKEELVGGYLEGFDVIPLKGPINWFKQKKRSKFDELTVNQQKLGQILTDHGYYYIHINEECILNASTERGSLNIGSATLKAIIFPLQTSLSVDLAEKLQSISEQGIHLIFIGAIPNRQSGFLNWEENDLKINKIVEDIKKKPAFHFIKKNKDVINLLMNGCKIKPFVSLNESVQRFGYIKKRFSDSVLYFLRNGTSASKTIEFSIQEPNCYPYKLDLLTGKEEPFPIVRQEETQTIMRYEFTAYESIALSFKHIPHSLKIAPVIKIQWEKQEIKSWTITYNKETMKCKFPIDLRKTKFSRYSGPFIYTAEFSLKDNFRKTLEESNGSKLMNEVSQSHERCFELEFTKIHEIAEVSINGNFIGTLFAPPYRIQIPNAILKNENRIQLKVTGCLRNLLVGMSKQGVERLKSFNKKPIQAIGVVDRVYLNKKMI